MNEMTLKWLSFHSPKKVIAFDGHKTKNHQDLQLNSEAKNSFQSNNLIATIENHDRSLENRKVKAETNIKQSKCESVRQFLWVIVPE